MVYTSTMRSSWLIPTTRRCVLWVLGVIFSLNVYIQIRRDARINWIVNPVHKRREARGLTSIGKQVGIIEFM